LMSILGVEKKELQHSNFLAWLFDPFESHGLGDYFLKEFIKLFYENNGYEDLGPSNTPLSVYNFVTMDLTDIQIQREHKNIDLFIHSEKNKLVIVIENKIFSKEHSNQLTTYREYVERTYADYPYQIFIYLSLLPQEITEKESQYYVQITYEHVITILEKAINNANDKSGDVTLFAIQQYLRTLRSIMNKNEEIEELAKKIYNKYRPAFDLVMKYVTPSAAGLIPNDLLELIDKEESIVLFHHSKTYVRFLPKRLINEQQRLIDLGFINEGVDWKSCWLFLFEFHITNTFLQFDMKIGEYPHSDVRENLYNHYSNNTHVFKHVVKPSGNLNQSWHLAFKRRVVKPQEYMDMIGSEDSELREHIKKRFKLIVEKDVPNIVTAILGENQ